jgi:hypothetical protein
MHRAVIALGLLGISSNTTAQTSSDDSAAVARIPCAPRDGFRDPVTGRPLQWCPPGQIVNDDDQASAEANVEIYSTRLRELRERGELNREDARDADLVLRKSEAIVERARSTESDQ